MRKKGSNLINDVKYTILFSGAFSNAYLSPIDVCMFKSRIMVYQGQNMMKHTNIFIGIFLRSRFVPGAHTISGHAFGTEC